MISPTVVERIRQLLREDGLSQRQIARQLGVSRGTVNAIARGKRPDYEARRRPRPGDIVPPSGPYVRCPICGARVQMPCLACQIRALLRERRRAG